MADDQRVAARAAHPTRAIATWSRRREPPACGWLWTRRATGSGLALEAHPDVVKVNQAEARELLGVPTARREEALAAASKLRDLSGGDGHAGVVTRGADGVVVAAPDGTLYEGRLYVRGRYPVGSGDAFLAA